MKINESMQLILDRECFDEECPGFYSKYLDNDIRVCIDISDYEIYPGVDVTSCKEYIESDNDLLAIAQAWKYIKSIVQSLKEVK